MDTTKIADSHKDDDAFDIRPSGLGAPGKMASYAAFFGEKQIASASFALGENGPFATAVKVDEAFRRQGVASRIYAKAADFFGRPIVPSTELTPDSVAFWLARGAAIPPDAVIRTMAEWDAMEDD